MTKFKILPMLHLFWQNPRGIREQHQIQHLWFSYEINCICTESHLTRFNVKVAADKTLLIKINNFIISWLNIQI